MWLEREVKWGAAVFQKQPLVIVNQTGESSPDDVVALAKAIQDFVNERFGIDLNREVEYV